MTEEEKQHIILLAELAGMVAPIVYAPWPLTRCEFAISFLHVGSHDAYTKETSHNCVTYLRQHFGAAYMFQHYIRCLHGHPECMEHPDIGDVCARQYLKERAERTRQYYGSGDIRLTIGGAELGIDNYTGYRANPRRRVTNEVHRFEGVTLSPDGYGHSLDICTRCGELRNDPVHFTRTLPTPPAKR